MLTKGREEWLMNVILLIIKDDDVDRLDLCVSVSSLEAGGSMNG